MTIIHSYHEAVIDGNMTVKQFYDQYKTARDIKVGCNYAQRSIFKNHADIIWSVLFIDNNIAFCRSVDTYDKNKFKYDMFICSGNMAGWRYNDNRACYRLYRQL